MRYVFLVAVLALLWCVPAYATPDRAGAIGDKFAQMDKNGDGKVSWEEFSAAYPQMREAAFEAIDTSGDAFVSLEEWEAFSQGHSRDMMSSGMGGMGGMTMPPSGMGQEKDQSEQKVRELFELAPRNK